MKKISTTTKVYTLNLHNLKLSDNGQPQNVSTPNKPVHQPVSTQNKWQHQIRIVPGM